MQPGCQLPEMSPRLTPINSSSCPLQPLMVLLFMVLLFQWFGVMPSWLLTQCQHVVVQLRVEHEAQQQLVNATHPGPPGPLPQPPSLPPHPPHPPHPASPGPTHPPKPHPTTPNPTAPHPPARPARPATSKQARVRTHTFTTLTHPHACKHRSLQGCKQELVQDPFAFTAKLLQVSSQKYLVHCPLGKDTGELKPSQAQEQRTHYFVHALQGELHIQTMALTLHGIEGD